jgi:hypothetical protein
MIRMLLELITKLLTPPPQKFHGVMGIFAYVDDATDAIRTLRKGGHREVRVFSPVPYHAIEHALDMGPSLVRWVTFTGGVLGFTGGMSLCVWSVLAYPLVTGGKELVSIPPFMIISYESMILLAGISTLLGMLALARLPEVKQAAPYDVRFQEDRIGIWVPCAGDEARRVEKTLMGHGAEEVTLHA